MEYSFSRKIKPYLEISEVSNINIEYEISLLNKEIDSISIETIPFDKWDYFVILLSGVCGGLIDIFLGKPSGYAEPRIKNNSFFGLGEQLKEYDLKNNPIDEIPGTFGGDHRLYSYGHDMLRFFNGINLIMGKTDEFGIAGTGEIFKLVRPYRDFSTPDSYMEAILILAIHLYKDFWTQRSLPIPGSTIIADLNNNKMPELLNKLTNEQDLNLRQLSAQVLSVSVIEIINRIYLFFKYHNSGLLKIDIIHKRDKMLLLSHSIAMLFNAGKIIVTKNPFFLNVPQITRILILACKTLKEKVELTNRAILKSELSVLRNKYELLETLILLDKVFYYTSKLDKIMVEQSEIFNENIDAIIENRNKHREFKENTIRQLKIKG